jgi:uncharacterized protein YjbI with pentapeptide repeats
MTGRPSPTNRSAVGSRRWIRHYRAGLTVGTATVAVVAFAVLLLRGAAWLYGPGLRRLTPDQQVTAIDDVRGRLIQLGAGLLALGALVYTARTFRLSREGHVTDRYTKAIEQLGSEHLGVRLGAIYALERIMIDSPRDHPTIVEVLAAFVRESARLPDTDDRDPDPEPPATDLQAFLRAPGPVTDVQAALTVLGRRPSGREERGRLNLRSAYLPGADLTGADLRGVDLTSAHLHRADLRGADLTGAHLFFADLTRAIMSGANLTWANLSSADLTRANLTSANLTRATLVVTNLTSAFLSFATLTRAALTQATFIDADLQGANLADVIFEGADLTGANLTDAVLPAGYVRSTQPDPNPDSSSSPPSAS